MFTAASASPSGLISCGAGLNLFPGSLRKGRPGLFSAEGFMKCVSSFFFSKPARENQPFQCSLNGVGHHCFREKRTSRHVSTPSLKTCEKSVAFCVLALTLSGGAGC